MTEAEARTVDQFGRGLLEAALGFVYPPVCQICGDRRATAAEGFVCSGCALRVRFIVPPFCERCGLPFEGDITGPFKCANCREMDLSFKFARSAVMAGDLVLDLIHRYKYRRELWFEPFLAELFCRQAGRELRREDWDAIVPVPLHPTKHREREFNQAGRLGSHLSAATHIPLDGKLLRRVVPTRTQTQLTRKDRAANVRRAFALRPERRLSGERLVLVDDVFTTGATTSACAKVLLGAGAATVCVWTLARGKWT